MQNFGTLKKNNLIINQVEKHFLCIKIVYDRNVNSLKILVGHSFSCLSQDLQLDVNGFYIFTKFRLLQHKDEGIDV